MKIHRKPSGKTLSIKETICRKNLWAKSETKFLENLGKAKTMQRTSWWNPDCSKLSWIQTVSIRPNVPPSHKPTPLCVCTIAIVSEWWISRALLYLYSLQQFSWQHWFQKIFLYPWSKIESRSVSQGSPPQICKRRWGWTLIALVNLSGNLLRLSARVFRT